MSFSRVVFASYIQHPPQTRVLGVDIYGGVAYEEVPGTAWREETEHEYKLVHLAAGRNLKDEASDEEWRHRPGWCRRCRDAKKAMDEFEFRAASRGQTPERDVERAEEALEEARREQPDAPTPAPSYNVHNVLLALIGAASAAAVAGGALFFTADPAAATGIALLSLVATSILVERRAKAQREERAESERAQAAAVSLLKSRVKYQEDRLASARAEYDVYDRDRQWLEGRQPDPAGGS